MIKRSTIKPGLVFCDPNDKGQNYWRVTDVLGVAFECESVRNPRVTRQYAMEDGPDLERLEPVAVQPVLDLDLTHLIGQRVRVRTNFGSVTVKVAGTLRQSITVLGKEAEIDVGIVGVDGESYHVSKIKEITEVAS